MKHSRFLALTALALWAVFGAVAYAAFHPVLEANIPFDFMVGNTWLPAGNYTIVPVGEQASVLSVHNEDSNQTVLVGTMPTIDGKATKPAAPRFIFNRYDGKHYLAKVWKGIDNTGRELPKTRLERELALRAGSGNIVSIAASLK